MASIRRIFNLSNAKNLSVRNCMCYSSQTVIDNKKTTIENGEVKNEKTFSQLSEYRFIFPEFLPDPKYEFRNKIREKLEREDMLKRRTRIDIPEFYVGSILAVTCSDPFAPGKENKFVGLCIQRTYAGLRATFVLRNVVDGQGMEIMYDMYNPSILTIDVLRLEKRLDDELLYLRDAPLEYSAFPLDMEPEFIIEGEPVQVNPLKVKLKPLPWCRKWEQYNLKGVDPSCFASLCEKLRQRAKGNAQPWEDYDLMKQYRRTITEEDQQEIWEDLHDYKKNFPVKQQSWKRTLQKSKRK